MATLKLLSNAKSPNLIDFDRQGILDDLITAIKSDPDWNALWDGELLQNASFMYMNYFAYMAEKGYTQFNRSIRENFLYEAKDPVSVSNILAQRNINLFQNRASIVNLTATLTEGIIVDSMLTTDLQGNRLLSIINALKILGADQNGALTAFEAIPMAPDGKPDYKNDVQVIIGQTNRITFNFDVYAGQTLASNFLLGPEHEKNFFLDLPQKDIIENSIRIYWDYGSPDEIELIETASFSKTINQFTNQDELDRWSGFFPFGVPSYIAKFDTNGGCRIYFGNDRFGGSFKNQEGKVLTVFVRSGGGSISNVNAGKIDYVTSIPINSSVDLPIRVVNENSASGGADRETLSQAKIFSLYRNEDDRIIVKDADAINILRAIANKQKVDSPFYVVDQNVVPILHSFNFIAPNRLLNDFVFPLVLESDTVESYRERFLTALNEYLNLQGIKDGVVIGEVLTDFVYSAATDTYNTFVKLKDINPMNGSLVLKAIKYNGSVSDTIEFNMKYLSGIVFNTSKKVPARQFSALPFENVVSSFSVPSGSNRIILNYDESGDIEIELSTVSFVDVATFAAAFNSLIQNALTLINPTYYNPRSAHIWVYYDVGTKTLIFESPTIGYGSSVRVKAPTLNSSLDFFGLTESLALPLIKTENVFLDDTYFEPATGEIFLSIRRESVDREIDYNEADVQTFLVQEPSAATGPTFDIILKDKNGIDVDRVKTESDILIDFYVQDGNSLVLKQEFRAKVPLVSDNTNSVVNNMNGEGTLVPPADSIINYDAATFDYNTSKLHLAFVDSLGINNALPLVPPYAGEFDSTVDNLKLTYKYKIDKTTEQISGDNGLWGGTELANILTAPAPLNFPLGFQIKDFTDMKITLYDGNDNVVSGTSTLIQNSSNIIGNITFFLSGFPTCYASTLVVTKTGSNADSITFSLQNSFNFGTSFASYPAIRKINKIKFEYINEDQIVETITASGNPELFAQDVSQAQGPRLNYVIDKNADEISTDVNFLVEAYAGVTLKESYQIPAALNLVDQNIPTFVVGPNVGPLGWFKHNNSIPDINFYRITSGPNLNKINLSIKVKDSLSIPNAPVPPYLINPLLSTVKKMVITYKRRTYEFITADYKQDQYYPEGEAKSFSDILNSAGTKMMGFHHLIKRVNFVPMPVEVNLRVKKGFSTATAAATAKALIYDQYGYANSNYRHNIGDGLAYGDLKTLLNRNDLNESVASAEVINPATDVVDSTELKNTYYFALPELLIQQLEFLEQTNQNIIGIADTFSVTVGAERV
jgi:hypothetical protein